MPDGTHAQKCMQTASTRMGACTPGEYGLVKLALLCDLIGGVLTMRGTADLMMADIKAKDTGDTTGVPTARGAFSLSAIQVSLALSLSSSRSLSLALSAAAAPPPLTLYAFVRVCVYVRICARVHSCACRNVNLKKGSAWWSAHGGARDVWVLRVFLDARRGKMGGRMRARAHGSCSWTTTHLTLRPSRPLSGTVSFRHLASSEPRCRRCAFGTCLCD